MGKGINKITKKSPEEQFNKYFSAKLKCTQAFLFECGKGRQLAALLISDVVPLQENKKLVVCVAYRYITYLKGEKNMEIKSNKIIDVRFDKGLANLFDKRTGQVLAQLRYNTAVSPMDTMAFISAVAADYERYMKLIAKYYGG